METAALQSALDELNSNLGEAQPERVHVVQCDAMVHRDNDGDEDDPVKHQTFEVADYPVTFTTHGRAGTSFRPLFEYVEERGINPACVIYFSDMECED